MNKSFIFAAILTTLTSCAMANTNNGQQMMINGKQVTVYENFKLIPNTDSNEERKTLNNNESINSLEREIVKINNFTAVESSTRENSNLALVVSEKKAPYIIKPNIYFVCPNQGGGACNVDGFEVNQVGDTDMFRITVNSLEQWKNVIELLRNNSNVTSVMPDYDYGIKNSAK